MKDDNGIGEPVHALDGSGRTPRPVQVTLIAVLCFVFAAFGAFGSFTALTLAVLDFEPGDTAPGRDVEGPGVASDPIALAAALAGLLASGVLVFAGLHLLWMRRKGRFAANLFAVYALVMTATFWLTDVFVLPGDEGTGAGGSTESIAALVGGLPGAALGVLPPLAMALAILVTLNTAATRKLLDR